VEPPIILKVELLTNNETGFSVPVLDIFTFIREADDVTLTSLNLDSEIVMVEREDTLKKEAEPPNTRPTTEQLMKVKVLSSRRAKVVVRDVPELIL
jgi:hypothetical protein